MHYVDIVAMLAVLQYLVFGALVGKARGKYGIKAPAITGSEGFERIYRVHMNTLELLVALLPALYVAARYWPAQYVAALGAVYLWAGSSTGGLMCRHRSVAVWASCSASSPSLPSCLPAWFLLYCEWVRPNSSKQAGT
ncbi:MAPEG family protein [Roseateles sp. GG27B]